MVIAVDFDHTLYSGGNYGDIGTPNWKIINKCKDLRKRKHILTLWTCRTGEDLEEALMWCKEKGLEFDYVGESPTDKIELFKNDPRKIYYDYLIDDRNVSFEDFLRL